METRSHSGGRARIPQPARHGDHGCRPSPAARTRHTHRAEPPSPRLVWNADILRTFSARPGEYTPSRGELTVCMCRLTGWRRGSAGRGRRGGAGSARDAEVEDRGVEVVVALVV